MCPWVLAALERGKHVVSDKPARDDRGGCERSCTRRPGKAGVVHAVTFNYRGNPLVQQAREMIAGGELGRVHFVHGGYLQDWLLQDTDFSWRLEPEKGGRTSAVGDIGSHWCDLVQHVIGQKIVEVLADFTTVIGTRLKPSASTEAFASASDVARESFSVSSEDPPASSSTSTVEPRARCRSGRSAPATRTISGSRSAGARRRCAGCRNGRTSSGSGAATARTARSSRIRRCSGRRPGPMPTCRVGTRRRGPTRSAM